MGGRGYSISQGICGAAGKTAQGLHQEWRRRGGDGISGGINVVGVEGVAEKGERERSVAVRIRRRAAGCEGTRAASEGEIALAEIGVRSRDVCGSGCVACGCRSLGSRVWRQRGYDDERCEDAAEISWQSNRGGIRSQPRAAAPHDLVDCGESHVSWPGPTAGVGRSRRDRRFVFRWPGDRDPRELSCGDGRALSRRGFG